MKTKEHNVYKLHYRLPSDEIVVIEIPDNHDIINIVGSITVNNEEKIIIEVKVRI